MVNDDIERLHRFGSQLKQISDHPTRKKVKPKTKTRSPVSVFHVIVSKFTSFRRKVKQRKITFLIIFSYKKMCVEMKAKKIFGEKRRRSKTSAVRLIERKYHVLDRTIIIRRRKRVHPQMRSSDLKNHPDSILIDDQYVVSSGLFDVPISDE
jgi:hypothetical protein